MKTSISLFFFLSANFLYAQDFITLKEYAKMLYENPRGISCKECHGIDGKEQVLGYYIKEGKKIPYKVPSIQNLNFEEFKNTFKQDKDSKSIMPNYSLTDNEIITLYNYINQFKEQNNDK